MSEIKNKRAPIVIVILTELRSLTRFEIALHNIPESTTTQIHPKITNEIFIYSVSKSMNIIGNGIIIEMIAALKKSRGIKLFNLE